ncbi:hypothetical protein Poli38472_007774 [Pythium oligandrum]|uniref:Uncharacterized protein n=1 Tax=Pythium oligandrum TaxID=41045 RepID=A0A8K1FQM5_PYTOL|nr:hypothetical protein Poli38472_007774 [Pythium oligandrum]|eukprot:TMW68102.1 hypothetical protein Poli38472_007774 [Pythium oligandrum]
MVQGYIYTLEDSAKGTVLGMPTFSPDTDGDCWTVECLTDNGWAEDFLQVLDFNIKDIATKDCVTTKIDPRICVEDGIQLTKADGQVLFDKAVDEILGEVARMQVADDAPTPVSGESIHPEDPDDYVMVSSDSDTEPRQGRTRRHWSDPYQRRSTWVDDIDGYVHVLRPTSGRLTRAERRRTDRYRETERARTARIKDAKESKRQQWLDLEYYEDSLIAYKYRLLGAYSERDREAIAASERAFRKYQEVATAENKQKANQIEELLRRMRH